MTQTMITRRARCQISTTRNIIRIRNTRNTDNREKKSTEKENDRERERERERERPGEDVRALPYLLFEIIRNEAILICSVR